MNGNGHCPYGKKCHFSHAIVVQQPLLEADSKVEIYFMSIPENGTLTLSDIRSHAEKFGSVTNIYFNRSNGSGRLAGKLYMNNKRAADAFINSFDNMKVENGGEVTYVRARIQNHQWLPDQQTVQQTTSFNSMTSSRLKSVDEIYTDAYISTLLQFELEQNSAYNVPKQPKRYPKLSEASWPVIARSPEAVVDVAKGDDSTASTASSWQTVVRSRNRRMCLKTETFDTEVTTELAAAASASTDLPADTTDGIEVETTAEEETTVPMPTVAYQKKALVELDWIEFERLRKDKGNAMTKPVWNSVDTTTPVKFEDNELYEPINAPAMTHGMVEEAEDEDEDFADDTYDEEYSVHDMYLLVSQKFRKRIM